MVQTVSSQFHSRLKFQTFKTFNRFAESVLSQPGRINPPSFIFPRVAGEERGEGWNYLNGLNVWNTRDL